MSYELLICCNSYTSQSFWTHKQWVIGNGTHGTVMRVGGRPPGIQTTLRASIKESIIRIRPWNRILESYDKMMMHKWTPTSHLIRCFDTGLIYHPLAALPMQWGMIEKSGRFLSFSWHALLGTFADICAKAFGHLRKIVVFLQAKLMKAKKWNGPFHFFCRSHGMLAICWRMFYSIWALDSFYVQPRRLHLPWALDLDLTSQKTRSMVRNSQVCLPIPSRPAG